MNFPGPVLSDTRVPAYPLARHSQGERQDRSLNIPFKKNVVKDRKGLVSWAIPPTIRSQCDDPYSLQVAQSLLYKVRRERKHLRDLGSTPGAISQRKDRTMNAGPRTHLPLLHLDDALWEEKVSRWMRGCQRRPRNNSLRHKRPVQWPQSSKLPDRFRFWKASPAFIDEGTRDDAARHKLDLDAPASAPIRDSQGHFRVEESRLLVFLHHLLHGCKIKRIHSCRFILSSRNQGTKETPAYNSLERRERIQIADPQRYP